MAADAALELILPAEVAEVGQHLLELAVGVAVWEEDWWDVLPLGGRPGGGGDTLRVATGTKSLYCPQGCADKGGGGVTPPGGGGQDPPQRPSPNPKENYFGVEGALWPEKKVRGSRPGVDALTTTHKVSGSPARKVSPGM